MRLEIQSGKIESGFAIWTLINPLPEIGTENLVFGEVVRHCISGSMTVSLSFEPSVIGTR
jgi:hypothetical protein